MDKIKQISDEEVEITKEVVEVLTKDSLLNDKKILEDRLAGINEKLSKFEEPKSI